MKKFILILIVAFFALFTIAGCQKLGVLSSEEKALVGTWKKWDNWAYANCGNGWTDRLVLNSDHSCQLDVWWVADGSSVEKMPGTWAYDKNTRVLTYNVKREEDGSPWDETKIVVSISDTKMTLMDLNGGSSTWERR